MMLTGPVCQPSYDAHGASLSTKTHKQQHSQRRVSATDLSHPIPLLWPTTDLTPCRAARSLGLSLLSVIKLQEPGSKTLRLYYTSVTWCILGNVMARMLILQYSSIFSHIQGGERTLWPFIPSSAAIQLVTEFSYLCI